MIRLHVVVEGQSEEAFVNEVLAAPLADCQIVTSAHRITTSRKRGRVYRGGFVEYSHLRRDLDLWMKQDQQRDARFTTMVDLYRMPPEVPGFAHAQRIADPLARARHLESCIQAELGDWRFVPYIQVHEFEALLFSEAERFGERFPESRETVDTLIGIATSAPSPEHIDDGPETSPSKRILAHFPGFSKAVDGPIIASAIGLPTLQSRCAHFNEWCQALLAMAGA